jgi:hypothetical protein
MFFSVQRPTPYLGVVVVLRHRRDRELPQPLPTHRNADQAARFGCKPVDLLGVDQLGGENQVALVLAAGVVQDNRKATRCDLIDRILDAVKTGFYDLLFPPCVSRTLGHVGKLARTCLRRNVQIRVSLIRPQKASCQSRPGGRQRCLKSY